MYIQIWREKKRFFNLGFNNRWQKILPKNILLKLNNTFQNDLNDLGYNVMSDLADKKCIPCEGGIPSFNLDEIHKYLKKVDGWDVETENKKDYYITKTLNLIIF